jgi:hypothetical protein
MEEVSNSLVKILVATPTGLILKVLNQMLEKFINQLFLSYPWCWMSEVWTIHLIKDSFTVIPITQSSQLKCNILAPFSVGNFKERYPYVQSIVNLGCRKTDGGRKPPCTFCWWNASQLTDDSLKPILLMPKGLVCQMRSFANDNLLVMASWT